MTAGKERNVKKVAIIGAGPAGLAAALQLKRFGISALLLEGDHVGGLLRNANLVENYPGFPGGIAGKELVDLFWKQAEKIGVEVTFETVTELARVGSVFQISTTSSIHQSHLVVVASGTVPVIFDKAMVSDDIRQRIFYEVYPLLSEESKRIVIIGAGDAAFDYALNLARKNDVIVLNRAEHTRCLPLLWDRAAASDRIQYRPKTSVSIFTGSPYNSVCLECESSSGKEIIEADYVIGALGREPSLDFLSASLRKVARDLEHQGVLHLIGDVHNGLYRQTTIAVGEGIRAAMHICQLLKEFVQ